MQLSYYIHNNPLRAGMVKRLVNYRWSSYPAYAYNRRHRKWLNKELILSQIQGENKHRQYREKCQKYSNEKIGNILGLTHSAVSKRVSITRKKMEREKGFNGRIKDLKSQIKP